MAVAHSWLPAPKLRAARPPPGPALFAPKPGAPLLSRSRSIGCTPPFPFAEPFPGAGRLSAAPQARALSGALGCGLGGAWEARSGKPAAEEGAARSTSWRWLQTRLLLFSTWSAMEL